MLSEIGRDSIQKALAKATNDISQIGMKDTSSIKQDSNQISTIIETSLKPKEELPNNYDQSEAIVK